MPRDRIVGAPRDPLGAEAAIAQRGRCAVVPTRPEGDPLGSADVDGGIAKADSCRTRALSTIYLRREMMRVKLAVVAAVASIAAVCLFPAASSAQAAPGAVDLTGQTSCSVACSVQLVGFNNAGGTLNAVLEVTNEVTGQTKRVFAPITAQQGGTCTILELTIRPIDLFLLGISIHIDQIHLVITAERGTLLGDLLCGLFFGNQNQLVAALNEALREGAVALGPPV
jgi:hypothetical protein